MFTPQVEAQELTSNLFPENDAQLLPTYSEDQKSVTSSVLALADINNSVDKDVDTNFASLKEEYSANIDMGGEDVSRDKISSLAIAKQHSMITDISNEELDRLTKGYAATPEEVKEVQENIANLSQIRVQDKMAATKNAAEESAVKELMRVAEKDPTMAQIMYNNFKQGDSLQLIENNLVKNLIISRDLDRLAQNNAERSWGRTVWEFLGTFNTFSNIGIQRGNLGEEDNNILNTAQSLMDQRNALMDPRLSLEEFNDKWEEWKQNVVDDSSFISEVNKSKVLETMEAMLNTSEGSDAFIHNAWNFADVASWVPAVGAYKLVSRNSKLLALSGNRKALADQSGGVISKAIASEPIDSHLVSLQEAVDQSLPKAMKTVSDDATGAGLTVDVSNNVESLTRIRNEIAAIPQPSRLTDEEMKKAVESLQAELKTKFQGQPVVDFIVNQPEASILEDFASIDVLLGKASGGGFSSENIAKSVAKRKGLDDVTIVTDNSSGQYFIKQRHMIDEKAFMEGVKTSDVNLSNSLGHITQFLKSGRNIGAEQLADAASLARATSEAFISHTIKPRGDLIEAMSRAESKQVEKILAQGHMERKWYTDAELQAKGLNTRRAREGYNAVRELNDIDYVVRNAAEYKRMQLSGKKTFEINSPDDFLFSGFGKELKELGSLDLNKIRIYDVSTKSFLEAGFSKKELEELLNKDFRLIEVEGSVRNAQGDPVKFILSPKQLTQSSNLPPFVIPYLAGGHRVYKNKYFVKQMVNGVYTDTGQKFIMNPLTHANIATKGKAQEWAAKHNEALELWRSVKSKKGQPADVSERIEELTGKTYKEWDEMIQKGEIADSEFEVLFDKELPKKLREAQLKGGVGDLTDDDVLGSGTTQWLQTSGKSFQSARGEHLLDDTGELAPILDPFESVNKALNNSIGAGTWINFQDQGIARWVKGAKASRIVDERDLPAGASDYFYFMNAKLDDSLNPEAALKLGAQRDVIKRQLNMSTKEGRTFSTLMRRFAEWVENKPTGSYTSEKALDLMDASPINAIRGMTFNLKLGVFNPAQLFLQAQTTFAISALDPVNATKGIGSYMPMRHLLANKSPALLDHYAKSSKWRAMMGFNSEKEVKTFIEEFRKSGAAEIGKSVAEIDSHSHTVYTNFWKYPKKFNEWGKIPFDEGERINRIVAYRMAWERVQRKFPNIEMTSSKARTAIAGEVSELNLNMASESAAFWNRGILSIPTQFKSHQMRLLEAIFDGKKFTAAERTRLAVGQLFFYGAAGMPITNYIADKYFQHNGEKLDPLMYKAITNGFWDTLLFGLTDGQVDTDFSSRAGIGAGWEDTISGLFGGEYGTTFFDVMGGPAGSAIVSPVANVLSSFSNYHKRELGLLDALQEDTLRALQGSVSTWSVSTKAWYMWNYGMVLNRKDLSPIAKSNKLEAVALILGLPPQKEKDYYELMNQVRNETQAVREAAKIVKHHRMQFLLAHEDPEKQERIGKEIEAFMSGIDNYDTKRKIIREVNKSKSEFGYTRALLNHKKNFQDSAINERLRERNIDGE